MMKQATFGAVLIALLLLATAGAVGYALSISSHTTIEKNTIEDSYIVLTSTDYEDILAEVEFTTENDNGTITYTLVKNYDSDGSDGNDSAKITNDFTIRVAPTNVEGTFDLAVTISPFTAVPGLTYTMKVGTQAQNITSGSATFTGLAYNTDLAVIIYVSGTPTSAPGATLGFTNYSADPATVGSVFNFTATPSA